MESEQDSQKPDADIEALRVHLTEVINKAGPFETPEQVNAMADGIRTCVKERDEESLRRLPQITIEMEKVINAAKTGSDSDVFKYSSGNIYGNDLKSLAPGAFPNEHIVEEYLTLINLRTNSFRKVIAFPEAIYQCLKDGRCSFDTQCTNLAGSDVSFDVILFPAKHRTHWFLIAVFPATREIKCYDNRHKNRDDAVSLIKTFLIIFLGERRKNKEYPTWTTEMVKEIPKLKQSCDSAVYVCKYAEYLSAGKRLIFNNDHIDYFRDMMIWEIVQQKLN